MKGAKLNLIGQTINKLTIIGREVRRNNNASRTFWKCRCECGTVKMVRGDKIRNGRTKSCGCSRQTLPSLDSVSAATRLKTYTTWKGMFARCGNPNNKNWKHYGAKGIIVCKRWFSFTNFLADMGERPNGMSIDRINHEGNYEPSNCRWATNKEQANNTSKNRTYVFLGNEMTIGEAADCFSTNYSTLHRKITEENIEPDTAIIGNIN